MWLLIWLLPLCVLVVGVLVAAIPTYFGFRFHQRGAEMMDMRPRKINKLRSGPAKVRARVVAQERLLRSPMKRRPCVYYRFIVRQVRGAGRNRSVTTLVDDIQAVDVVLDDGTGQADIDLHEAQVEFKDRQLTFSGTFRDPPPDLQEMLEDRYGVSTRGLIFNKALTYIETHLADRSEVVVVGEVKQGRQGYPIFRRGETPLIIGDRGDSRQLRGPDLRKAVMCWIGGGVLLILTLVFTLFTGMFALMMTMTAPALH